VTAALAVVSPKAEALGLAFERHVLGALILEPGRIAEVVQRLAAEDFQRPRHGAVYASMLRLHERGAVVEPLNIAADLQAHGEAAASWGGPDFLLDCAEEVVTAAALLDHVGHVAEAARRRRLLAALRKATDAATNGATVDELNALVAAVQVPGVQMRQPATAVDVLARWAAEGELRREPTGIPTLDAMTGGGPPRGTRIYIQGPPDNCKTAVLVQLADRWAAAGMVCGLLLVDADPDDITTRLLQRRGWSRAQCERRDPADIAAMQQARDELGILLFDESWTIEEAGEAVGRRAAQLGMPCMLGIDSVQTVRSSAEKDGATGHEAITARVKALRAVSDKYRMTIVATSEMSRGSYRSNDRAHQQADMAAGKESGSIEYSARLLLSVRAVEGLDDVFELRVVKSKYGARHKAGEQGIRLRLDRAAQRLAEVNEAASTPQVGDEDQRRRAAKHACDVDTIVATLAAMPSAYSIDAVVRQAGLRLTDGRAAFHAAMAAGRIVPEGSFRKRQYRVAGGGVCAPPRTPPTSGTLNVPTSRDVNGTLNVRDVEHEAGT
jgi:replicative DNA helicase